MGDTNYFTGIVKILENPLQNFMDDKILTTTFRVEISQVRQNKIIILLFWGNLAKEVNDYYQKNDYILIEGYTSIKKEYSVLMNDQSKKIIVTVLKVYPLLLNSNKR